MAFLAVGSLDMIAAIAGFIVDECHIGTFARQQRFTDIAIPEIADARIILEIAGSRFSWPGNISP